MRGIVWGGRWQSLHIQLGRISNGVGQYFTPGQYGSTVSIWLMGSSYTRSPTNSNPLGCRHLQHCCHRCQNTGQPYPVDAPQYKAIPIPCFCKAISSISVAAGKYAALVLIPSPPNQTARCSY